MPPAGALEHLVKDLRREVNKADVTDDHLWLAVRGALDPDLLICNLAEALRISGSDTRQLLIDNGFGDIVAHQKRDQANDSAPSGPEAAYVISASSDCNSPFPKLFSVESSPAFSQPVIMRPEERDNLSLLVKTIAERIMDDAFLHLYRDRVGEYYKDFVMKDGRRIESYIGERFGNEAPRYIVNSGIGANEQFNHLVAHINNSDPDRRSTWIVTNSPRQLRTLPDDATVENTLFMEFSRSGKTEETVKIHEYTPRRANRIVFANAGPLRDIGERDGNLVLKLPDQVSGRFGRNKTPILLAPMLAAGVNVERFWQEIEEAIAAFDLSSPTSLPMQMAQFIYLHQRKNSINHIYLGCNDDVLCYSADEFLQFWNEGVNKNANDISMSGYFGLLRDSHANIEGILANRRTKLAIFLLSGALGRPPLHPMTQREIDPIDEAHRGLEYGDEERVLVEANYARFAELMPTIKIQVHGEATLDHAAILGQLWADVTLLYSRLVNIDPGSNPEVKYVRDRSATLLSQKAARRRKESSCPAQRAPGDHRR